MKVKYSESCTRENTGFGRHVYVVNWVFRVEGLSTLGSMAKSFSKSNLGVRSILIGSSVFVRPLHRSKEHVYLRGRARA